MPNCKRGHPLEGKNVQLVMVRGMATIRCKVCYNATNERYRRKKGVPVMGSIPELVLFERHFEKTEGCWLWNGALDGTGYGQFLGKGNKVQAHVYSYRNYVGMYSDDLDLDHICEVKRCVNPAHLEPVTRAENMLRYFQRRKAQTITP